MNISRRDFLRSTFAAGAAFTAPGFLSSAYSDTPPDKNILFIILDDLNDSVEGFGGHRQAKTPNINRLAKRGVKFNNAATNAPLCSPSRPSMLTGLYPHTSGYFCRLNYKNPGEEVSDVWDMSVFSKAKTWIQYFKEHGYDAPVNGKIYHNGSERESDLINEHGKRLFPTRLSFGPFPYPENENTTHPSLPYVTNPISAFGRLSDVPPKGWSLYNKPFRYESETKRDKMPDELAVEWTENYLKQYADSGSKKPFLLNVGLLKPHEPFIVPDKYFDMFPLDDIELAPGIKEGDLDDCAPFLHKNLENGQRLWHSYGFSRYNTIAKHNDLKRITQAYLACVAFADDMVGKVITALENSPYKDNTLIILTSDHAYHIGEKEYIHKETPWERSARIPLVIAGPGIEKGTQIDAPVSLIDIYPTLIEYAGLPSQPHPHIKLDGHSLMPLLKDTKNGKWAGPEVSLTAVTTTKMFRAQHYPGFDRLESKIYTVRSKKYRYIICPDGGQELYDMINDPFEWNNLAYNSDYADIKNHLHAQAEKLVGIKLGVFYHPNTYTPR